MLCAYLCKQFDRVTGNTDWQQSTKQLQQHVQKHEEAEVSTACSKTAQESQPRNDLTNSRHTRHCDLWPPLPGVWCSDNRKRRWDGRTCLPASPRSLGLWLRADSSSRQQISGCCVAGALFTETDFICAQAKCRSFKRRLVWLRQGAVVCLWREPGGRMRGSSNVCRHLVVKHSHSFSLIWNTLI